MATQVRQIATAHGVLSWNSRCLVMGVLNVTPDSFSDGGHYLSAENAIQHGIDMARDGADVIDIGGESTRPGAVAVPGDEQIRRVLPVIHGLRRSGMPLPISIDTRIAEVAAAALDAGADLVNDVSAARHDPDMLHLVATRSVPVVLMHMQGTPETMQVAPIYHDVVLEVEQFFEQRIALWAEAGIAPERILVDPGIGFGKTLEHNLALLRAVDRFAARWPVLVGPSRKRFIGELRGIEEPQQRDEATAEVVARCAQAGAAMVRVHDVRRARRAIESCRLMD